MDIGAPMVDTAYATVSEYQDRNGGAGDEVLLTELLTAASRYLDRRLGWCPGAFSPLPESTQTFWPARLGRVLRFRDVEGKMWPLRSWSEIVYSRSGTDDSEVTVAAPQGWILAISPRALRLKLSNDQDAIYRWPCDPGYVKVTGEWGSDSAPPDLRELTVHVARSYQDSHRGGAAAVIQSVETPVTLNPAGTILWRRVEMELSAGRMGHLGLVSSAAASNRRHGYLARGSYL